MVLATALLCQAPARAAGPDAGDAAAAPPPLFPDLPDGGAADGQPPPGIGILSQDAPGPLPAGVLLEAQNSGLAIARRYVLLLLGGKTEEALLLHDTEGGRRPDLAALRAAVGTRGPPADLLCAPVQQTGAETTSYFLTARYPAFGDLSLKVAVDHAGHVSGVSVGPQAVLPGKYEHYDRYDGYRQKATLSLPFAGEWTTANASPGADNGHYLNANQRFAIDWFITRQVGKGTRTYRDRGRDNSDYFAYGKEILAPAPGKVVQVIDGVPDNLPGRLDVYFRLGNVVVIDLGHREYAYLCHLKQGSIKVRRGQTVRRGQGVARCGNSGNSTEPHLHFQLADGPLIAHAGSLPAVFQRVLRNGLPAERVQPLTGDHLAAY